MADPTPPTPPQPASTIKPPKGPADELEGGPLDLLRQNAGTMVAILVAVVALAVLLSYRSGQAHRFELQGWQKLAELRKQQPGVVDGFPEAARTYEGTEAEPFIRTAWAARLYESGERAKVERALELFKQVLKEHPRHPLFGQVLPEQVAKIEAELASPRAHLIKLPGTESGQTGSAAAVGDGSAAVPGSQTPVPGSN